MKRVFCCHSSKNKAQVEAIASELRANGIDAWFDGWEITSGDDIVARINDGLGSCDVGLVFVSQASAESLWARAETSTLIYKMIEEGCPVIPVLVEPNAPVPALLKPRARLRIDQVRDLVDAILHRRAPPPLGKTPGGTQLRTFTLRLETEAGETVRVTATLDGEQVDSDSRTLPMKYRSTFAEVVGRTVSAKRAEIRHQEAIALEQGLVAGGEVLGGTLFTEKAQKVLAATLDDLPTGCMVHLVYESTDRDLLALPLEGIRLPATDVLALNPRLRVSRRLIAEGTTPITPIPGPLKILVAVGAPDEEKTNEAVLDLEAELRTILDSLDQAGPNVRAEVRILEVGHPKEITKALKQDAYHVLHLSGHGRPGRLELENEDGEPVEVDAARLAEALREGERPIPLVFLSSCHGARGSSETVGLAEGLLREGVPAVLSMQSRVTDRYATELAGAFYRELGQRELATASGALAVARREAEQNRRTRIQNGEPRAENPPEYATACLLLGADERPLVDTSGDEKHLSMRSLDRIEGPVPQLGIGMLIGRRRELRELLRALRALPGSVAAHDRHRGIVITGMGGVGKSALAGRAMARMREGGWAVGAISGMLDLQALAGAVGVALLDTNLAPLDVANALANPQLADELRIGLLRKLLATTRLLVVLDNFEDNLTVGGRQFLDPTVEALFRCLLEAANAGKLLLTSRYPIPGMRDDLPEIPLGPLSLAQTRKLLLRLEKLKVLDHENLGLILRRIGGHPRTLELLDGVLHRGTGRLNRIADRLRELAESKNIALDQAVDTLEEGMRTAIVLATHDVFLDELLELAEATGDQEALFQAAVSSLAVEIEGLAHMLHDRTPSEQEVKAARASAARLTDLSLLTHQEPSRIWVHRWTAESMRSRDSHFRERCRRAGEYRMWRSKHETHSVLDGMEGTRNFMMANAFEEAGEGGLGVVRAMRRFGQSVAAAAFAGEVLSALPSDSSRYLALGDEEASAHLALGWASRALERYLELMQVAEARRASAPERAGFQRDLSVLYDKVGDIYRALGKGDEAREYFLKRLAIGERLAKAEPERADYQRDLSVSYERLGDIYRKLGEGDEAREYLLKDLAIAERLAKAEPERADYQRDLSVSYERLGDTYRDLGKGDEAREYFLRSHAIAERLAKAEPERADYQRDLSVSYNKVGDVYRDLGKGDEAREYFLQALHIRERLAKAEPERADYQRDLSVSYERLGDIYRELGKGDEARECFLKGLAIAERLAKAEPERADYQRSLSVSYNKVGDVYRDLGKGNEAREYFLKDLAIAERLAKAEPERADYQRDLSVSYNKVGDIYRDLAKGDDAREYFLQALHIRERLAKAEPERADYQRDLSVSYERLGDIYRDLGKGDDAREYFLKRLAIAERLAKAEPERADYQRDLEVARLRLQTVAEGD